MFCHIFRIFTTLCFTNVTVYSRHRAGYRSACGLPDQSQRSELYRCPSHTHTILHPVIFFISPGENLTIELSLSILNFERRKQRPISSAELKSLGAFRHWNCVYLISSVRQATIFKFRFPFQVIVDLILLSIKSNSKKCSNGIVFTCAMLAVSLLHLWTVLLAGNFGL